ncbi:substrate-binding domain-containing protein [Raoultella planticola]|uniref:substrate-binding domain-containing protein n=1 Tax=Raoultella planticola TaxID=575 RepID=UPI00388DDACC
MNIKNKIGAGLLVLAAASVFSGCNREDSNQTVGADAKKTLGVTLPNLTNPYYVAMKKSFEENGAAMGFNVKVSIADNDDAKQLSQVQSFIQQKVDAVAVNCVSSGPCVSVIGQLNQAKIPAFTINLLPDTDGMKQQGISVVQGVQTDQKAGGYLIGEELKAKLGENGKAVIGIVGEPTSISANARDDGFKEALKDNKNVSFVALVNGKVEETTSLKVTTEMLQGHPDINIVFSDTEPAAMGALAAINQLGVKDKVALYSFVDKEGVKAIKGNSVLKAGAIQEPVKLAQILVESVKKSLGGEKVPEMINNPPLLVNEKNADDVIGSAY